MIGPLISRKAPCIRILLVAGAFLAFIPRSWSQYDFNPNCTQAYHEILALRFSEASMLIAREKLAAPSNLVPVYLANYMDFLTLVIGEDRQQYDRLKDRKGQRIKALEQGRTDSPFYNFCLGEVYLQWAVARLKFGDYATAAFEIHKANELFSANESKFPSFTINKIGMGMIHVMVGLVPENYRWLSDLAGLEGSVDLGMSELRQVAGYTGPDKLTGLFKKQASFYLAFLTLNLQSDKKKALPMLEILTSQQYDDPQLRSPLMIYAKATILMRNGFNDQALEALRERASLSPDLHFFFLDYLEGMARLNKLDYEASAYFEKFIAGFKGRNYIRSAFQKLAWIALLRGDSAGYYRRINQVPDVGASVTDEDKQAGFEAADGVPPNLVLLRARLLSDGGYYGPALDELLDHPVRSVVRSKRDFVEYSYRLGRIYHETGNLARAAGNYRQTIARGKTEPYYFAAGAAYQLGLLYENSGAFEKADSAYTLCLSIKTREYRASLRQKARSGLNRVRAIQPKT